jgi:hypothetical protein
LRQRRLGAGAPAERITGAWREFTDALRLAGRPVPAHLAASEAAAFAAQPPVPRERKGGKSRADADKAGKARAGGGNGGEAQAGGGEGDRSRAGGGEGGKAQAGGGKGDRLRAGGGEADRGDASAADPAVEDGGGGAEAAGVGGVVDPGVGWRPEDAPDPVGVGSVRAAAPPSGYEMPPLDELVAAVNTVGFAPEAADGQQAERAGQQAVAYAEALRAKQSWWRRVRWRLHPGPLRWHRD